MKKPKILGGKVKEEDLKFVTAPANVFPYLTAGKKYEVIEIVSISNFGNASVKIYDDTGYLIRVSLRKSSHDKKKGNFKPSKN